MSIEASFAIKLTPADIDKVCQIGEIAWQKYFSKPLPGYSGMKVFWNGKEQLFHLMDRSDQVDIIKSAHVSRFTKKDIEMQRKASPKKFQTFINAFIGFNEGNLLAYHGIAHAVRTAIMAQLACEKYYENFEEFANLSPRILFCSLSASLLHDIGRCFGGDMYDVFGSLSAEIASEILNEVGGFSENEIDWIKEAIAFGGLNKDEINSIEDVLNEKQLIACLMGDADSYEFERFADTICCNIEYTSIKSLGLCAIDDKCTDDILNDLKNTANSLSKKISEPKSSSDQIDHINFLRDELNKLNTNNKENE